MLKLEFLTVAQGFYQDFARVADDESRHLSWCLQRLEELGYGYGDMVAHSILWDGAVASSGKPYANFPSMMMRGYLDPEIMAGLR